MKRMTASLMLAMAALAALTLAGCGPQGGAGADPAATPVQESPANPVTETEGPVSGGPAAVNPDDIPNPGGETPVDGAPAPAEESAPGIPDGDDWGEDLGEPDPDDGLHAYELSNGIVLKTKTRVEDYIDGGVIRLRDMAVDWGFDYDADESFGQGMYADAPVDCDDGKTYQIHVGRTAASTSDMYVFALNTFHWETAAQRNHGYVKCLVWVPVRGERYYIDTTESHFDYVTFDIAVLYAYGFENFSLDNGNPLDEVFAAYEEDRLPSAWKEYYLP